VLSGVLCWIDPALLPVCCSVGALGERILPSSLPRSSSKNLRHPGSGHHLKTQASAQSNPHAAGERRCHLPTGRAYQALRHCLTINNDIRPNAIGEICFLIALSHHLRTRHLPFLRKVDAMGGVSTLSQQWRRPVCPPGKDAATKLLRRSRCQGWGALLPRIGRSYRKSAAILCAKNHRNSESR
jgi:hypothetical protein